MGNGERLFQYCIKKILAPSIFNVGHKHFYWDGFILRKTKHTVKLFTFFSEGTSNLFSNVRTLNSLLSFILICALTISPSLGFPNKAIFSCSVRSSGLFFPLQLPVWLFRLENSYKIHIYAQKSPT